LEPADFGIRELMRLGEDVEVLAPSGLRAQMARTLCNIAKRYGIRR